MFTDIDKNIMNTNKLIYNNNSTSEEINNYSMTLYKNDLNYTFGKILFLIVVIICIYFPRGLEAKPEGECSHRRAADGRPTPNPNTNNQNNKQSL